MSIAQKSLLRLIVEEVALAKVPGATATHRRFEGEHEVFEVAETRHVHAPPFATSMHFWAHALRGFLERSGRPELFAALATNCRCESAACERLASEWSGLAVRFGAESTATRFRVEALTDCAVGAPTRAYRMIAEASLLSWLAEREDALATCFWADSKWLAVARPIEID